MNIKSVESIARAVLYEGYMLYPYRPSSVKNRQRFNFGVLYPKSYGEETGSDPSSLQTEVLVEGDSRAAFEVRLRFLKLVDRRLLKLAGIDPAAVNMAETALGSSFETCPGWQEATECEVVVPTSSLVALSSTPLERKFAFPAQEDWEPVHDSQGRVVGMIIRKQELVQGKVEISAVTADDQLFKVRVQVKNLTPVEEPSSPTGRDFALMRSLVSAHAVLGAVDGHFLSLLEPPEGMADTAACCENVGAWPVLAGDEGSRDTMLASPIILYDYPQIAPESPGDLFDGTEIDEILALRILTLTDDEKDEIRNSDERARRILERTESLPMEHLRKLHGTLRELRPLKEKRP
jgi:hydrogenase maturation protease